MRMIGAMGRKFCRRFTSLFKYLSRKLAQGTEFLFVRRAGARMAEKRIFKRARRDSRSSKPEGENLKEQKNEKQRGKWVRKFAKSYVIDIRPLSRVRSYFTMKKQPDENLRKRSLRRGARLLLFFLFFCFFVRIRLCTLRRRLINASLVRKRSICRAYRVQF